MTNWKIIAGIRIAIRRSRQLSSIDDELFEYQSCKPLCRAKYDADGTLRFIQDIGTVEWAGPEMDVSKG